MKHHFLSEIGNHRIAKQPEVIFHNLLLTIVSLEIFGLIPMGHILLKHCHRNPRIQPVLGNSENKEKVHDDIIELGE